VLGVAKKATLEFRAQCKPDVSFFHPAFWLVRSRMNLSMKSSSFVAAKES
jgi:hypothetical protein